MIPTILKAEVIFNNRKQWHTKCECNAPFIPGIVLDPFMGSGTTAVYCEHFKVCGKRKKKDVICDEEQKKDP